MSERETVDVQAKLERLGRLRRDGGVLRDYQAPRWNEPLIMEQSVPGERGVRVHEGGAVLARDVAQQCQEFGGRVDGELAVGVRRLVVEGEAGGLERADGAHLRRPHAVCVGDDGDLVEQVAAVRQSRHHAPAACVFTCSHVDLLPAVWAGPAPARAASLPPG